jgi:hypothetical protein
MADTKISDLTAATSIAAADLLAVVQGGVNKKIDAEDIRVYVFSGGAPYKLMQDGTTAAITWLGGDLHLGYPNTEVYFQIIENQISYINQSLVNERAMFTVNWDENSAIFWVQMPSDNDYHKAFEITASQVVIGDVEQGNGDNRIIINQQSKYIDLFVDASNGGNLMIDSVACASGSFTSQDGKTITVTNGLITAIV